MRILIVDDSAAMRMMVVRTLRQAGYGFEIIDQAEDGRAALDKIRRHKPDLVLADWNMPNMDGLELLGELRREETDLIFGFVTAESTLKMRRKAINAGASFVIAKPFTIDSFAEALDAALG